MRCTECRRAANQVQQPTSWCGADRSLTHILLQHSLTSHLWQGISRKTTEDWWRNNIVTTYYLLWKTNGLPDRKVRGSTVSPRRCNRATKHICKWCLKYNNKRGNVIVFKAVSNHVDSSDGDAQDDVEKGIDMNDGLTQHALSRCWLCYAFCLDWEHVFPYSVRRIYLPCRISSVW